MAIERTSDDAEGRCRIHKLWCNKAEGVGFSLVVGVWGVLGKDQVQLVLSTVFMYILNEPFYVLALLDL